MKGVINWPTLLLMMLVCRPVYPCKLKHKTISLSGPVTHYLHQLGIGKSENLHAISSYSQMNESDYSGKIYGGGIFLSKRVLEELQDVTIFYDQSNQLHKAFKNNQRAFEVRTLGKNPFETFTYLENLLSDNLVNCKKQKKKLSQYASQVYDQFQKTKISPTIFFLGRFQGKRPPERVISGDHLGLLFSKKTQKAYPSSLSYALVSQKIYQQLVKRGEFIFIGLDGKSDGDLYSITIKKEAAKRFNVQGRTLLIPGIPQIRALSTLLKFYEKNNT